MMTARRLLVAISLSIFLAPALHAATYIVPSDAELIDDAAAIVTGTVVSATSRFSDLGPIETVFDVAVDESFKGHVGERIQVVEWGGRVGDRWTVVSGAPRYAVGARYLMLMVKNRTGAWSTEHLTLGRFAFTPDSGTELLLRESSDIHGFDTAGRPAVERRRDADAFIAYIRDRVRGLQPATEYFVDRAAMREDEPQPQASFSGYDFAEAAATGAAAWTDDPASDVGYTVSLTPASNATLNISDGEEKIIEEDPQDVIPGGFGTAGVVATAFWSGGANHPFEGKEYITIEGSDIVTQNGIRDSSIGQNVLRTAMVHEIGHTLGFRHSDQDAGNSGGCAAPLPCSGLAVMTAGLSPLDGVLQAWDVDAVRATYGNGGDASDYTTKFCETSSCTVLTQETGRRLDTAVAFRLAELPCVPVSITTQPPNKNISPGASTNVTVVAAGSAPLSYQWYVGTPGTTTQPVGTNSPTLTVTPGETTTYWVRISNSCDGGSSVDSNAATVAVVCSAPAIATQPSSITITDGQSTQLQVNAFGGGLSYQWYVGNSGDVSQPIGTNSNRLTVSPTQTTSFWVRVSGTCGAPVDSNTATVSVAPCADLTVDPPTATARGAAGSYRLNVNAFSSSGPLLFQWFRGNTPGVGGTQVGGAQTLDVTVTAVTSYWARVTNACGKTEVTSLITVAPCTLPAITTQPEDQTIPNGGSATLTVAFTPVTATVKWYQGDIGDKTTPVGATATINVGPLTETTKYWAEVALPCGPVASRNVTVDVEQTSTNLGMLKGRFKVQVRYRNQFANPPVEGVLTGKSLVNSTLADTAVFWFDTPLIVELMVRVSDARPFDNNYHVYYGGLSDVEFFISVTDTVTGKTVEYHKAANSLRGEVDRKSFPADPAPVTLQDGLDALMNAQARAIAPNADTSTLTMLGRYSVRMRYRNQFASPATTGYLLGRSIANAATTDTAVFYFENPESVEWMVRFSDVRPFANRVDFFHGGLSDVQFWVEVKDTQTGAQKEYPIAPFSLSGGVDRVSFVP